MHKGNRRVQFSEATKEINSLIEEKILSQVRTTNNNIEMERKSVQGRPKKRISRFG